ncbi:MAG: hypothetical protein VX860_05000 [Verrucomicrobiota bacterium]|nr:hypothetical protein [Verrucomicrobiota bacterium]
MDIKKLILLNVLWALVAVGAYFYGNKVNQGSADLNSIERSSAQYRDTANSRAGSGHASKGPGPAGLARKIQNDQLETGTVLSGEVSRRMSLALTDTDPIRRKARIAEVLLNLTATNAGEILSAFENGPRGGESDRHWNDFLYAWGRVSGEEAVKYAMNSESPRRSRGGETTAISGWAASDPDSAQKFVATIKDEGVRQWWHRGVVRELVKNDLDGAIVYSEQNVKSRARGEQMDLIANELVEQRGTAALVDWVNGIDHTQKENDMLSYKSYAAGLALDRIAREDSNAAVQFVVENADQPFLSSETLERAARRVGDGFDEELQWLIDLPEEVKGQRHAIGERFEDYIREDFEGAGKWLASQSLGPAYDEAIQDYAMSAAKDNPEVALAWVDRISDQRLKDYTLGRLKPKETKIEEK